MKLIILLLLTLVGCSSEEPTVGVTKIPNLLKVNITNSSAVVANANITLSKIIN